MNFSPSECGFGCHQYIFNHQLNACGLHSWLKVVDENLTTFIDDHHVVLDYSKI